MCVGGKRVCLQEGLADVEAGDFPSSLCGKGEDCTDLCSRGCRSVGFGGRGFGVFHVSSHDEACLLGYRGCLEFENEFGVENLSVRRDLGEVLHFVPRVSSDQARNFLVDGMFPAIPCREFTSFLDGARLVSNRIGNEDALGCGSQNTSWSWCWRLGVFL